MVQKFETRYGWRAILRADKTHGYWLRIYNYKGSLLFKWLFPTALSAKHYLENLDDGWFTVSGYVEDATPAK